MNSDSTQSYSSLIWASGTVTMVCATLYVLCRYFVTEILPTTKNPDLYVKILNKTRLISQFFFDETETYCRAIPLSNGNENIPLVISILKHYGMIGHKTSNLLKSHPFAIALKHEKFEILSLFLTQKEFAQLLPQDKDNLLCKTWNFSHASLCRSINNVGISKQKDNESDDQWEKRAQQGADAIILLSQHYCFNGNYDYYDPAQWHCTDGGGPGDTGIASGIRIPTILQKCIHHKNTYAFDAILKDKKMAAEGVIAVNTKYKLLYSKEAELLPTEFKNIAEKYAQ